MTKIIQQTVVLPAPAGSLFGMYLDPKMHGAITGSAVRVSHEAGAEFVAFDGMISGRTLSIVPQRLIVQAWRAGHWKTDDIDSTLILTFWHEGDNGRIELVHVNVPDHDFEDVNNGWEKYYWTPWREFLQRNNRQK